MGKFTGSSVAPGQVTDEQAAIIAGSPVEDLQKQVPQSSVLSDIIAQQVAGEPAAAPSAPPSAPIEQEVAQPVEPTPDQLLAEVERGEIQPLRQRLADNQRVDTYERLNKKPTTLPDDDGGFQQRARKTSEAAATGALKLSQRVTGQPGSTATGDILTTIGAQQNVPSGDPARPYTPQYDPKFFAIQSAVTENFLADTLVGEGTDAETLQKNLGPGAEEFGDVGAIGTEAVVTKAQANAKLGRQLADEYARSSGREPPQLSREQATVLGDAAKEVYAQQNPDIITRVSNGDGSQVYYQLTEDGANQIALGEAHRKRAFPKQHVRPQKTPLGELVGDVARERRTETGTVGRKGNRGKLEEAKKNLNSIPNVVDSQRLRILYATALPVLAEQQGPLTDVFAEINNVGPGKARKFAAAQAKADAEGKVYDAEKNMNGIRRDLAQSIYGIATERKGANFLTYYTQAYNGRLSPQQTHFDPTTSKAVRFVTRNATPSTIKPGSRQDANIRQMYAMMLVKGADTKLPRERERMLGAATPQLLQWGRRLQQVLDQSMTADQAEAISQAIEQGLPLTDPNFPQFQGLQLDPEADADLIQAINNKGEDGPHFIDGLIDFVGWHNAVIQNKKPYHSYFNAYIDGKTNGLAANGIQMGSEQVALTTGVIRNQDVNLLDDGDIRDQLKDVLLSELETNGITGVKPEDSAAVQDIARAVFSWRDLNKATTMTFGYGQEMDAFANKIEETIGELYEIARSGDQELIAKHGLDTFADSLDNVRGKFQDERGSFLGETLLRPYSSALTQVLSEDGIAARSLMKGAATMAALAGEVFHIKTYSGMDLNFGGDVTTGSAQRKAPQTFTVSPAFIAQRDQRAVTFQKSAERRGETRTDHKERADAELIEQSLIEQGLASPATGIYHDYIDTQTGEKVDVKTITKNQFANSGRSFTAEWVQRIAADPSAPDSLEFWGKSDWKNEALQVGDTVKAKQLARIPLQVVLDNLVPEGNKFNLPADVMKKLVDRYGQPETTQQGYQISGEDRKATIFGSRATAAAPKVVDGKVQIGRKAIGGSVPGPVQSLDAETIALSVTGKSWDRLKSASGGNPYFHSIYDAIKMDANGYDVVLEEVNNNWLKAAMEWSYLKEMSYAQQDVFNKAVKALRAQGTAPVDTSATGKYAMIGYLLSTEVSAKGTQVPKALFHALKTTMNRPKGWDNERWNERVWDEVYSLKEKYNKYVAEDGPESIPADVAERFLYDYSRVTDLSNRLSMMVMKTEHNKKKLAAKIKASGPVYQYYAH